MVADFRLALEEAERVRFLSILGLQDLGDALDREESKLGVSRRDEGLSDETLRILQAAWERGEMARIEIENGHPQLNAQALLSMNSALDALVEEFVPAMRDIHLHAMIDQVVAQAAEQERSAATALTPATQESIRTAAHALMQENLPKLEKLRDSGAKRYERRLAQAGLDAPADRPIPDELDHALAEIGALRDVLMHRAGRMDVRALEQAPSLRFSDGELVRVSDSDYRRYSAAIRCYSQEILFRSVRHWPRVTDEKDGPKLDSWRRYHSLLA